MDDNDFIMRQVKSFAEGLGVMLNNKDGNKSVVFFEQEQGQSETIKERLDKLVFKRKYDAAVRMVFEQKFILSKSNYVELAQWLLDKFNQLNDVDNDLKMELDKSIVKVSKP